MGSCRLSPTVTTFATVDASFADLPNYFSSYGWPIHVCGAAWSWRVSKTSIQTHSACESEYYAIDDLAREVQFVRKIFADLRVEFPKPLPVLEDNMGAIALTSGPTPHHQRTKHIGYRFHYVRSLVKQCILRFQHQDTAEQPADIFTKFLTEDMFSKHAAVLLGTRQLKIVQKPLPRSTRIYLELHNQQLEQTKRDMEERTKVDS